MHNEANLHFYATLTPHYVKHHHGVRGEDIGEDARLPVHGS